MTDNVCRCGVDDKYCASCYKAEQAARKKAEAALEAATTPRTIDTKFHVSGSQIVKTSNGEVLPPEEPLFLMRARDYLAVPAITFYLEQGIKDHCTDYWEAGIRKVLKRFLDFAKQFPERMKQPGITRGL